MAKLVISCETCDFFRIETPNEETGSAASCFPTGKHISVVDECWMRCSEELQLHVKHLFETENKVAQQSPLSITQSLVFQAENI